MDTADAEVRDIGQQFEQRLCHCRVSVITKLLIFGRVLQIKITNAMMDNLSKDDVINADGETETQKSHSTQFMMADSGARGSATQIRQLAGMRWSDG